MGGSKRLGPAIPAKPTGLGIRRPHTPALSEFDEPESATTSANSSASASPILEPVDRSFAESASNRPFLNHDASPTRGDQIWSPGNSRFDHVQQPDEYCDPLDIGILYRVICSDIKDRTDRIERYSTTPFLGFEKREDAPNRNSLSIIDVSMHVLGKFSKPHRANQSRKLVGTDRLEDNETPFIGGMDFKVQKNKRSHMRIFSPKIFQVLRDVVKYMPGFEIPDDGEELFLYHPYTVLVFYHNDLKKVGDTEPGSRDASAAVEKKDQSIKVYDEVTLEHLRVLNNWLQQFCNKEIAPQLTMHHQQHTARFSTLWLLYKPGSTLVRSEASQMLFYKVESVSQISAKIRGKRTHYWSLRVWNLVFDGARLRRQSWPFYIAFFRGSKPIRSLDIYPVEYMSESLEDEKRQLIDRGKDYHRIICEAPVYLHYKGFVGGSDREHYIGGVVVDPLGFSKRRETQRSSHRDLGTLEVSNNNTVLGREPNDKGGGQLYSKFNDVARSKGESLEDEEMYLLMPAYIEGMALDRKVWTTFYVRDFDRTKPKASPESLRNLVLDKEHLELIKALGTADGSLHTAAWTADFVDNKGLGQIVALHGPPGVGKSFTVECLAQHLQRPLVSLSVADLGTNETSTEANFSAWLNLAQRWKAIILIDEADVFFGRRREGDYRRNALVTSFLRAIEYYPGMIFVTTNQPGQFDDAFISRLHLILEYHDLTEESRGKIWRNFLERLESGHKGADMPQLEVGRARGTGDNNVKITVSGMVQNFITTDMCVKELEMNGRDIRNAFHAAVKMALYRKKLEAALSGEEVTEVELQVQDVSRVVQNKYAFRKYQEKLHTVNEKTRAADSLARVNYSP